MSPSPAGPSFLTGPDPLIVSALLPDDVQHDLDEQRRRYFPPGRHVVGAHVTLFHALPGDRIERVRAVLDEVTARDAPALEVDAPFLLGGGRGGGVAYRLRSRGLEDVRAAVADRLRADLTDQDARRWRPHVTVQNKVDADEARALLARLEAAHVPTETSVVGLALWHYRGGPWESAGEFGFRT